jgi:ABC-type transport system involved in multi-copper enzyme maturation permease subunit
MTLRQAELKYYLRSPIIWLILAFTAFISAWSFLLSIDVFTTLQVKFAGMSDAPTITQGIIIPMLLAQSKLLIIVVAIIAGLSFARLSDNNSWFLLTSSQLSEWDIIYHKYSALLIIVLIFILPTLLALGCLSFITGVQFAPLALAILGLLLLLMWMSALTMLISSFVNNSGFSILLCLFVLLFLWVLSQSAVEFEWGKNWLQALTPFYHFNKFSSDYISFSSLFYFVIGTGINLWLIKIRLIQKRYVL